jgi:hypothetical protein
MDVPRALFDYSNLLIVAAILHLLIVSSASTEEPVDVGQLLGKLGEAR